MKLLSRRQKCVLIQAARRAYDHACRAAAEPLPPFDDWRHGICMEATGRPGLRVARNDDYRTLLAAFDTVRGEDGRAIKNLLLAQTERRQLEAVLVDQMGMGGFKPAYAETISQARFKRGVMDLDERQLLGIIMTVKERVRRQKEKREAALA